MANRFFNPNEQFCDITGLPYAGGTLAFYASGTSTPLSTYSDSALSIANTNPVVLDSAGRAGSIFLQNLAYKVVLSDVNANLIWTYDPVYASDYSTRAKLTTGSGSPNGNTAGTAGSAGIGADTYWDATNNILYVCTTTGNAAGAVWTAVNASAAASVVPPPQGYLTPTSGTPIIASDVIANTSLVYTPYIGNLVPIYANGGFTPTVFTELTLTLTASHSASTIYDVFVYSNGGVLTLVTGPPWQTSTAGSCVRGSATALTRLNGIWVNNISMSARNGAITPTVQANQGTYLGSIFIDAAAGQITLHRSYGQSRKWAIWNAYNRADLVVKAGDSTASWTYGNATVRASNAGTGTNTITIFSGLAEDVYDLRALQRADAISSTGGSSEINIGIGYNVSNAFSGMVGYVKAAQIAGPIATFGLSTLTASYVAAPALGINTITMCEATPTFASTCTLYGTEAKMLLSARWKA